MTSPLKNLLAQFRDRYPEGCLSADLVSIHDGQYVVRAVVSYQGEPLATGLAASVDVQIAEDKARDRAIAALGIHANQTATQTNGHQPVDSQPPDVEVNSEPVPDKPEEETVTLEPPEAELDPAEDMGPPIEAIAEDTTPPSAATIALENFNTSVNPVDLSDVIAQTDVELTRLGWTNVQGREYLEKTYGKRSRQQLTDEELMSFLLYLEDQ